MSLVQGVQDLSFWWLEGLPPERQSVAQARANVCMACPLNQPEALYEAVTGVAVEAFKAALEAKHQLNLKLLGEDKLSICDACGCNLILKPWVPVGVIFHKGRPDYFDRLHETCWIRKEEP